MPEAAWGDGADELLDTLPGDYLRVAYGQSGDREPRLPQPSWAMKAATVLAESERLEEGLVAASVRMRKAALVATTVPAGSHRIIFSYRGWLDYPLLLA